MKELNGLVEGIDSLIEFLEGMSHEEYKSLTLEAEFELYSVNQLLSEV